MGRTKDYERFFFFFFYKAIPVHAYHVNRNITVVNRDCLHDIPFPLQKITQYSNKCVDERYLWCLCCQKFIQNHCYSLDQYQKHINILQLINGDVSAKHSFTLFQALKAIFRLNHPLE